MHRHASTQGQAQEQGHGQAHARAHAPQEWSEAGTAHPDARGSPSSRRKRARGRPTAACLRGPSGPDAERLRRRPQRGPHRSERVEHGGSLRRRRRLWHPRPEEGLQRLRRLPAAAWPPAPRPGAGAGSGPGWRKRQGCLRRLRHGRPGRQPKRPRPTPPQLGRRCQPGQPWPRGGPLGLRRRAGRAAWGPCAPASACSKLWRRASGFGGDAGPHSARGW
mmetsp:Transcript_17613/g.55156  ORF Transcript_17613/g.55156 Transcript_17613/m.55156 type:complete len:220 (-) Transcript_17613:1516-2175(-)